MDVVLDKPTSNRFTMVASSAMCGTVTPELACMSEYTAATFGVQFSVTANTDYFVYVVDTDSGTAVLPNPIVATVTETDCATQPAAMVTSLTRAVSSTTSTLLPEIVATFDQAVDPTVGIVTVTGDMGTNLSYDLSTSPTNIGFASNNTELTITTGSAFPPGETVTVTFDGTGALWMIDDGNRDFIQIQ